MFWVVFLGFDLNTKERRIREVAIWIGDSESIVRDSTLPLGTKLLHTDFFVLKNYFQ